MRRHMRTKAVIGAAALTISLGGSAELVAAEPAATIEAEATTAITPVAATKGGISFGSCHFQKTPPYEPRAHLECGSREVVVAVFEDGIRCCELELK